MKKLTHIEKLQKLDREKKLDPNYVSRERDALKNGWKYKKPRKKKVKSRPVIKPKIYKPAPSEKYTDFLQSTYWYKTRKIVLKRDNNMCTKCGSKENLHVHHLTYDNHHNERAHLENLITVCKSCHEEIHGRVFDNFEITMVNRAKK